MFCRGQRYCAGRNPSPVPCVKRLVYEMGPCLRRGTKDGDCLTEAEQIRAFCVPPQGGAQTIEQDRSGPRPSAGNNVG